MKKIFVAGSALNQSNIQISPSVIIESVTFYPVKHDKVKIEGKYPYFVVAGIANILYNGSLKGVLPFNIIGKSQSHLKGNLSPSTAIPTENVLVPQSETFTYNIRNSNDDIEGFTVKLRVNYSQDNFSRELIISDEDKKKIKGVVSIHSFESTFESGMTSRNTSAKCDWVVHFRSSDPVDQVEDSSEYHEENHNGSWSPSATEQVPITDLAVGVMQPYLSDGDSSSMIVPLVTWSGKPAGTVNFTVKVNSFTEKVKSN